MSPCGSSNFTLAQVKAACYLNILTRCNQGKAGRTGGWCVGVGADGTCEKRALSICGCDPVTHPQCGGKWQSSVLERSFLAHVRPFAAPPSWTCGMPMGAWTLTSASNVVHLLISPVDLAAVLLRSVGAYRGESSEGFALVKEGR